MKKIYSPKQILLSATLFVLFASSCKDQTEIKLKPIVATINSEQQDEYDGPAERALLEFNRTKDPATGTVPREKYWAALQQTFQAKEDAPYLISAYGSWTERGPVSDAVGVSNGNTRANSGIAAGRIRSIMVDSAAGSPRMVWVGGVDGGLWKTTDITASPATWTLVNDYLNNLAVADICQDPTNPDIMYFATGESYFNFDAVQGNGVFKSTDHGLTWTQLASTVTYTNCTRILCDYLGNIYLSTRDGLYRSTKASGGAAWTDITPSGLSRRICDMEISSTSVAGRLHVVAGIFSTQAYRYTDIPITVAAGGWTSPAVAFPSFSNRAEIACSGNTLYSLVVNNNPTNQVPVIYKSTNGGANWAATGAQPTAGWANGQGWYSIGVGIDPSDANNCIVGGLDAWKTVNGGTSWAQISTWVGTTPVNQYVHADIHEIVWYDWGNKLLFGCDGGIHYSANKGTTIRDRNIGLRLKQFYSVAAHPTLTNYFLGGTQDNGTHQFSNVGLSTTVEVTGGDGAFVAIDQNQPQYQFGAYVFNNYRRSTNSGANWSQINFGNVGQFINPFDYDNANNHLYAAWAAGDYLYWDDPQTGTSGFTATLPTLNGNTISAVKVSPYTNHTVFFGTENDVASTRLVKVTDASTAPVETNISTGLPTNATVSCINIGSTDNTLIATFSNYGVGQVWVSTNGGTSWTNIDGNLPDMPVRWAMFKPGDESIAIIATETGVWLTPLINGGSTVWITSPTFPTVRTDMLAYRAADGIVAAATHGRGVWTQRLLSILPANNFTLRGRWANKSIAELNWENGLVSTGDRMEVEVSYNGKDFTVAGSVAPQSPNTTYRFNHHPAGQTVFYRIKAISLSGEIKYSNQVKLTANGTSGVLEITKLYPNPVQQELKLAFTVSGKGRTSYNITDINGSTIWRKEEELGYTGAYSRNWNLSGIRPGTYLFSISSGNEKRTQKFIKQ